MNLVCKEYYYLDIIIDGNVIRKGKYTKVLYPVTHKWLDYKHEPVTDPAEIARLDAAAVPDNKVPETFDEYADFMEGFGYSQNISKLPTNKHTILVEWNPSGSQEFINTENYKLISGDSYLIYVNNMSANDATIYLPEANTADRSDVHVGSDYLHIPAGDVKAIRLQISESAYLWEVTPENINTQSVVSIADSDYLVFRYIWESSAGRDLDSATEIVNSSIPDVDGKAVGYGCPGNSVPAVTSILKWAGDNTSSGQECVYISIKDLRENHIDTLPEITKFMAYATWFGSKGTGEASFSLIAYKGGTMDQDGYNFINTGGEVIYNKVHAFNVNTIKGVPDYKNNYTKVTDISYNKVTNTVSMAVGETVIDNQNSMEELYKMFDNYLAKDNTKAYTPVGDYNPATKKYADEAGSSYVIEITKTVKELEDGTVSTSYDIPAGTFSKAKDAVSNNKEVLVRMSEGNPQSVNSIKPVKVSIDERVNVITLYDSFTIFHNDPGSSLMQDTYKINASDNVTHYPINVSKETYYAEVTVLDTPIPSNPEADLECTVNAGTFEEMVNAYRSSKLIWLNVTMPDYAFTITNPSQYKKIEEANEIKSFQFTFYIIGDSFTTSVDITVSKGDKASCGISQSQFLPIGGKIAFDPTSDYDPATKKYIDDHRTGFNSVTTLTNLPTDKRVIQATLSENTELTVSEGLKIGEDLIVVCKATAAYLQQFPKELTYFGFDKSSINMIVDKMIIITITKIADSEVMYFVSVKESISE